MAVTYELLMRRTVADRGRVSLVKKYETNAVGQYSFSVWCSIAEGLEMKELNYGTFDEAFESYEKELEKLY